MIVFGAANSPAPFLLEAREGPENHIRFLVAPAKRGEPQSQCTPLLPDMEQVYEIIFEAYLMHLVRNESYVAGDAREPGDYFVRFAQSRLLDHIPLFLEAELVEALHGDTCRHYGIRCQNHIIDVLTTTEPIIQAYKEESP